jgi:hypothetical protein
MLPEKFDYGTLLKLIRKTLAMAEDSVTTTTSDYDQFAKAALQAQKAARAREARPIDCFLVTPCSADIDASSLSSPVEVPPFDAEQMHAENGGDSGGESDSAALLPGRAPLLDHLSVRVAASPDWYMLAPAIQQLCQQRLESSPKDEDCFVEVTLGRSSDDDLETAAEFLRAHMDEMNEVYLMRLLAVDVHCLRVVAAGSDFSVENSEEAERLSFIIKGTESRMVLRDWIISKRTSG